VNLLSHVTSHYVQSSHLVVIPYLLTCSLFSDAVSNQHYVAANDWVIMNWNEAVVIVCVCVKTNKCINYSFSLLIMYGRSYMFRHYIAILRERF
jgi:hypothetical protein